MLERYTRPEMGKIWSLENKYAAWLKVEIAATNAWVELGEVPEADAKKIAENASFTVERVSELEAITHHDVVAFTRTVSESLGEEKKWVHFGLTSTDVVDTAQGYILKQANEIILKDLEALKETIADKARKYKYTVDMLDIYEEIRIILLRKGLSMRKLAIKLREAGFDVPVEGGLSTKFKNETVRFNTVQEVLDYLGYEIIIKEKTNPSTR